RDPRSNQGACGETRTWESPDLTAIDRVHRGPFGARERGRELGQVDQRADRSNLARRVGSCLELALEHGLGDVLTPDLRVGYREQLLVADALDHRRIAAALGRPAPLREVGLLDPADVGDVLPGRQLAVNVLARQRLPGAV